MIEVAYFTAPSSIAGHGFFVGEDVARGKVIVAPDPAARMFRWSELAALPETMLRTSVRWFEERYVATEDWTPDCFINHSFEPTAVMHLGFVFARGDLAKGTEVTIDYRLFLGDGHRMPFVDARTGEPIVGFSWVEAMRRSTVELVRIFEPDALDVCAGRRGT